MISVNLEQDAEHHGPASDFEAAPAIPHPACDPMKENPLVRKDSIEELVGHRNRALELACRGLECLAQAESAAKRCAPQEAYAGFIHDLAREGLYEVRTEGRIDEAMEIAQRHIDEHAWASLQKLSGLRNLMDATAHEEMTEQLAREPPPFTVDNVVATFATLAARAPEIFQRSLVAVFERLDTRRYQTNNAFRIGPRVILTRMFDPYGFSHWRHKRELMGDLDRIFHTLDGKKPPEAGNAADAIEAAYKSEQAACTTEYFEVRMFRGNGNMHLKFRRPDLLDRANAIIARHYGTTLADNTKEA